MRCVLLDEYDEEKGEGIEDGNANGHDHEIGYYGNEADYDVRNVQGEQSDDEESERVEQDLRSSGSRGYRDSGLSLIHI